VSLARTVARPLLAAIFIYEGWDAIRHPSGRVKQAESVLPIAEKVPILPQDAEKLVRINGIVMVGARTLMALGKFRRLAALTLIGSIIPTTYAGHRFWEEEDESTKAQQRIQFLKNLGLLGGLILELFDTEGSPSLKWRVTHRRGKRHSSGGNELAQHISEGIGTAEDIFSQVAEASGPAIGQVGAVATRLPEMRKRAWRKAQQRAALVDVAQPKAALEKGQRALRQRGKQGRMKFQPLFARSAQALTQAKSDAQPLLAHLAQPVLAQSADALEQAKVNAQPVLAGAAKTLSQARANAGPVLSSAISRGADAWSHLPVGS
jgi:putative oxidoreductase